VPDFQGCPGSFETLRDMILEAESRRRDLDPASFGAPAGAVH
jgi:hypothetical protein